LFTISPVESTITSPFDVTADGQRFLVVQPSTDARRRGPLTGRYQLASSVEEMSPSMAFRILKDSD
jgi:hypothetical protein